MYYRESKSILRLNYLDKSLHPRRTQLLVLIHILERRKFHSQRVSTTTIKSTILLLAEQKKTIHVPIWQKVLIWENLWGGGEGGLNFFWGAYFNSQQYGRPSKNQDYTDRSSNCLKIENLRWCTFKLGYYYVQKPFQKAEAPLFNSNQWEQQGILCYKYRLALVQNFQSRKPASRWVSWTCWFHAIQIVCTRTCTIPKRTNQHAGDAVRTASITFRHLYKLQTE